MKPTARLAFALALTAGVACIEGAGGFLTRSVTLLSDAAHVAMDVLALAIALCARAQAQRPATPRQSYGFARMEVLAALGNGALLFTVTAFIVVEALRRLHEAILPAGAPMAALAAVGVAVNTLVGVLLLAGGEKPEPGQNRDDAHSQHAHHHHHHHGTLNMRAVLMHVAGDVLGGVAAIAGGLAIWRFQITWIDPVLSLLVAVIIVLGIAGIVREAIEVLLESAPSHADTETVGQHLRRINGVVGVHDLHIWSLAGAEYVLSAHVLLEDRRISEATLILREIESSLRETYAITHVTIQFECESCDEDNRVVCTQRSNG